MRIAGTGAAGMLLFTVALGGTADRPVPFRIGEALTYDVSWSSYLTAGTAVARVESREVVDGAPAYHIVAEGRPVPLVSKLYALDYRMETLLDTSTLLPRRASVYIEEGNRKKTRPTEVRSEAGASRGGSAGGPLCAARGRAQDRDRT